MNNGLRKSNAFRKHLSTSHTNTFLRRSPENFSCYLKPDNPLLLIYKLAIPFSCLLTKLLMDANSDFPSTPIDTTPMGDTTGGLGASRDSSFQTHFPPYHYGFNGPYFIPLTSPFLLGNDWAPMDYMMPQQTQVRARLFRSTFYSPTFLSQSQQPSDHVHDIPFPFPGVIQVRRLAP